MKYSPAYMTNDTVNLDDIKSALYKHFKDDPDALTTRIAEAVYDITTVAYTIYHDNTIFFDSREVFASILDWAWEFEYDWQLTTQYEDSDYMIAIEEYAIEKIKDYIGLED